MKTRVANDFIAGQLTLSCPYFETSNLNCQLNCESSKTTATQQLNYCKTEDYDNCPRVLCRVLRNSRPKFRGVSDLSLK